MGGLTRLSVRLSLTKLAVMLKRILKLCINLLEILSNSSSCLASSFDVEIFALAGAATTCR